jgi:hypothetical protein
MRLLLVIVELFLALPWWAATLAVTGFVALFAALGGWIAWKFRAITHEALSRAASPLLDAKVTVHSIEPAERPATESLFDVYDDDDDFKDADSEFDAVGHELEAWQTEGDFFWLDVTIAPRDPSAEWHASVLTLVPASWQGAIGEVSETIGPLHTVELADGDGFRTLADGEDILTGRQRVRLLMAAPPGDARVKFTYFGACFGDLQLPAGRPVGAR